MARFSGYNIAMATMYMYTAGHKLYYYDEDAVYTKVNVRCTKSIEGMDMPLLL